MIKIADIGGLIGQIRRVTNRQDSTNSNYLQNNEIVEYISDAARDIRVDYPDFTDFAISGSSITPTPDDIDQRLLTYRAAYLILFDDDVESAGDAIAIKAGSISLDTSKSSRFLSDASKRMLENYNNLVDSIILNGKPGATSVEGFRIDNYKETKSDTKDDESLI